MNKQNDYSLNNSKFNRSLNNLRDLLKEVINELFSIAYIDDVYWQVQAIIRENSNINKDDRFQRWITIAYVDSLTIRLRRLNDKRRDTISLQRVLNEMEKIATNLTREWYLSMHDDGLKILANKNFNKLCDKDLNHINKNLIKSKKDKLQQAVDDIEKYANIFIAHYKKNRNTIKVTFEDGRKAIASVFLMCNWCSIIINSTSILTPVPNSIPGNRWLNVFKIPWLDVNNEIPKYRHLNEIIDELERDN